MTRLSIPMLLSCTALFQGLCSFGADTQFKTDFSGGIPPEITLIDGDMNTPATAMAAIGFEAGVPWIGYYIEEEDEYVACSTSWYKPAGTSDDWMILPTIQVTADATLRWRARSSDKKYFDGYAVYVSTKGSDPQDFDTENPLFIIPEESNTWHSYELPLSQFEGQQINIAFVNNSTNKAKLYIDDIKAGTDYPILVRLDVPALVTDTEEGNDITVCGSVCSELEDPTTLGDLTLTFGEETIRIPCSELVLKQPSSQSSTPSSNQPSSQSSTQSSKQSSSNEVSFSFQSTVHLEAGENTLIEVSCQSDNGYSYFTSQRIWSTYRPLLVEEFTGTWCSWCVRGIVYMEALKEHYGDMFIPMCVHEYDIMEVPEYFSTVDYLTEPAIPNAIVNRKYEADPSALYAYCEEALTEDIEATFTSLTATCEQEGAPIDVTAAVAFSQAYKGAFSLAYVITEDNICVHADGNYCQKNAYAGGGAGQMGGFENMPSIIISDDISFRDVVRYVSEGGTHGVPLSLPGEVKAGEEYSHQYTIALPDYILNPAELSLRAMIVDNRTGEVLNARSIGLADILPGVNGIFDITSDSSSDDVQVYSVSGMYLGRYSSVEAFSKTTHTPGSYILRHSNGRTEKFLAR